MLLVENALIQLDLIPLSPTLSQVKTILAGFHVQNVHSVDVDKLNRVRPQKNTSLGRLPFISNTTNHW